MKLLRPRTKMKMPPGLQGDGAPDDAALLGAEMSFLDHLEDLRWALIKGFAALVIATIVCAFFRDWIIGVLLMGPAKADFFMYRYFGVEAETLYLQNRTITGQFFVDIGTLVAVGAVVGSPLFVYFMWRFVEPGLYPHEKSGLRFAAVFATLFFALGIAFGYCIVTPFALQFFANYQISELIANEFDITKYFGMVTWWSLGAGILFELPVVIYFLAKMGIATPDRLRAARKYAIVVVLILGAILTPPDPVSQVLVATPLMLLYEGSIYIAAYVERKALKRRQKEDERDERLKAEQEARERAAEA